MPSVGGARKTFFFLIFKVSEQVNLNHERGPYGKMKKNTKSLHPSVHSLRALYKFKERIEFHIKFVLS